MPQPGAPAVVVFDNGFHGRTLLTMAMTSKVRPYKAGFGPFPSEVYRTVAPYPYRGIDSDAAIAALEHLFKSEVDAESVACVVLETVQGEGGFIPMPPDYPAELAGGLQGARDPLRRGRGAVAAWAHRADVGGRALRGRGARSPRVGQVAGRRAAARRRHRARGDHGRAPRAASAARSVAIRSLAPRPRVVLDTVAEPAFRAHADELGETLRGRLDEIAVPLTSRSARCAGSGRCWRSSSREQSADLAGKITAAAFERGLLLLSCGLYGNVIRLLPPLTVTDDELDRGLDLLEESLRAAAG